MDLDELISSQLTRGGLLILHLRDGAEVLRITRGEASPGVPMSRDTVLLWLSSGKPVLALAIALLKERGQLSLDDRVADYLPSFAAQGKQPITIRHLLTHTAGLHRALRGIWEVTSWHEAIAQVCDASLPEGFIPGQHAAYDPGASWFILAEIATRAAGEPFDAFVSREVFAPAGMTSAAYSYSPQAYDLASPHFARYYTTARGHVHELRWNDRQYTLMPRPGGSLRCTIDDMCRFYVALLDGQIVRPDTLKEFTTSRRGVMPDQTFGRPMDWALGIMPNNGPDTPYNFGPAASPLAFGHGGQQSSIAFADPQDRSVFAAAYTSLPGEPTHNRRMNALLATIFGSFTTP